MDDTAKCVLITGGAGYIGSHTVLEMLKEDYNIIVVDNFSNAAKGKNCLPESLHRVQQILGGEKKILVYQIDLLDVEDLRNVFLKHQIESVIHFAALKAVGESVEQPLDYYRVNVGGTLNLLNLMKEFKVKNFVYSSSATVYGTPEKLPLDEDQPIGGSITNPYGRSKFFMEQILIDLCNSSKDWNIVILRYFNPVGAHESGMIGEDPTGTPNNLMPYVAQVAVGKRDELKVFGGDYDTPDGTGVRDYIHVVDLALGHIAALKKLNQECGLKIYNLGSGIGYSVLDIVKALEKASGKEIKYKVVDRRGGDVGACYSDPTKAEKELGWKAVRNMDKICEDQWRWQSNNPNGYSS
ncbi:UDP-glucose 4-epimerase-like isoform X2 [Asterias amurensis]|uniref:UDP-glucose 4-epimerase-like isoform X2 n=1 Tax=Asterias amurensis TaxID=7602 RepID=UPI003AB8AF19